MSSERIVSKFKQKSELYSAFTERTKDIVTDLLNHHGCDYVSVEGRTKTEKSLAGKLEAGRVDAKALEDIKDLSGIRVITFSYDDVEKIRDVLEKCFAVQEVTSEGADEVDRVGYRSVHLIISLPQKRLVLPEMRKFKGLKAEVQVRTVLQHAWAQIGHDRVYKSTSVLPEKIKRDYNLLSGLLEIADNEFARVTNEILSYETKVAGKTKKGQLNIPIDSISLRQYFDSHFGSITPEHKFGPRDDMAEEIIEEFNAVGIKTLQDLNNAVPKGMVEKMKKYPPPQRKNYAGLSRLIMISHNSEKYFQDAWNNKWGFGSEADALVYRDFGVDVEKLRKVYNV